MFVSSCARALMMPSKKLADIKVKTVLKKFKDKDFARGANRERILFARQSEFLEKSSLRLL